MAVDTLLAAAITEPLVTAARESLGAATSDSVPDWVVNLIENRIEVYTNPAGEAQKANYQTHQTYGLTDEIPVSIHGVEIGRLAVRELLP